MSRRGGRKKNKQTEGEKKRGKREDSDEMESGPGEGGGGEMEEQRGGIIRLMERLFGYSAEAGTEIMISQLA